MDCLGAGGCAGAARRFRRAGGRAAEPGPGSARRSDSLTDLLRLFAVHGHRQARAIGGMASGTDFAEREAKERAAAAAADLLVRKVQKLANVLRLPDDSPELRPLSELRSFSRSGAHAVYFGELPTTFHLYRSNRDAARDRSRALGPLVARKQRIQEGTTEEARDENTSKRAEGLSSCPDHRVVELSVWDVRGLVDLALTAAHTKLRARSTQLARKSSRSDSSGSPDAPPTDMNRSSARMASPRMVDAQALMQPPAWEHLGRLQ